ncbi:prephenate dehydrogenase/arogenate dehydrogenase family protein [Allocoprobacillus halotolerans]|uniref:Prephenate dehydrogenase/arogenate dehydrogenase family protein n=1 Tax=Allocoprobacillus halotolerans TaxID=2944914 RepID=A0ABY5HZR5_9FIRM|nr:prephenate dehydrogenase dimerization domain-containing protein [Allocoprobacillus halotolerans]UTY38584.1 prephenate dehydrogenase/arogenate dehydrogenase family protein [Allocoprobacillus halotolerans]
MFYNANYIVIQHEFNQLDKIEWMRQFVGKLGFKSVKIMSPYDHDEIISFTSQLPHTLAVALMNSNDEKYETGKYIGDSFRDLTRIANINADLWSELFFHNKEYLLASMERFEKEFDQLKQAIANGDEKTLKAKFLESSRRREKLEK